MENHEHNHKHEHEHEKCESQIKCSCCHDDDEEEEEHSLKKIIIAIAVFAVALVLKHLVNFENLFPSVKNIANYQNYAYILLCLIAYLLVGKDVVIGAVKNILKGKVFDEQFLMTVASLGAVFIGEVGEAVAVVLFYQIGEYFEDYAVDKSKDSIDSLMKICPDTANVIRDGKTVEISAEEVVPGDIVVVKPGERIPVDGIVVEGKSFIDTSALTGESVPREVFEGNDVFSGAINKNSVITIKAVRPASESSASRVIRLVSESSEKKTKTERFITRFSKVYTPTVCFAAIAVGLLPPIILKITTGNWTWSTWIYRALEFLVVSCPCAIVISVPLSFFGGIGNASRKGILVKGSSAIEGLSKAKTAVFDKTGTLTKGVFVVSDVHLAPGSEIPADELIAIAAHAETYSNHPAAISLKKAHHGECCSLAKITDAQEISGQGIKVNLNGIIVLAGNQRLMEEQNVQGFVKCDKPDFGTIVHVAQDGKYCGHIIISDETKEDSAFAIQNLKNAGVEKIVMLTGDTKKSAEKTAKELGITDVYSQLLPGDKVTKVEELLSAMEKNGRKKGTLLFAGDGINDAPVLARADIGIAMGGMGADAAIESADVVIMNDSISKIAEGIKISRKTKRIVYENIVGSLSLKVAIMILSALGITNMWLAVFGDVGICFLAILNTMRLSGFKKTENK